MKHLEEVASLQYFPEGPVDATFWVQATPGSAYWRCLVPARELPGRLAQLQTTDLVEAEGEPGFEFPRHQGAAIWQFPANTTHATILSGMKELGHKIIVEVDDDYTRGVPGTGSTWRDGIEYHESSSREVHRRVVKWSDAVICSTEPLAEVYRGLHDNVHVCPNSVAPQDWPEPKKPNDGVLRIGYAFSGSHFHDQILVAEALTWAGRQKDVEVILMGSHLNPLMRKVDFKLMPWTDSLKDYREQLQLLDIGLCPLLPNQWANSKSDIKAMEYAMAGAVPVVSTALPYKPWNDMGWLSAGDGLQFTRLVKDLVKNREDVKELAAQAKEYVLGERTISHSIGLWKEAISG